MWVKTRRANKKRKEDKQLCTVPEWYLLNGNPQRLKVTNMNKSKVTVFKKLRKKKQTSFELPVSTFKSTVRLTGHLLKAEVNKTVAQPTD